MAKIDTSKITGYAEMSAEDKLKALEAFEYEDNAAELEKQKAAVSKANSEAAEWKRKHNALLGEDEKKKQEQEEKFANMEKELSELREAKRVSEFKAKFIAQGYDEALAEDTAKAMADGDSAKVFANQQKFLDEYAKQVKADALKKTPKPTPGAGGGTGEMDYAKKIEEARTNGDFAAVAYYTRLQAEAEAQAKKEERRGFTMADQFAMSFGVLNYSGMLFNKGNTRTPLSSIIGGRAKTTNHVEFVTGQEFTSGGGAQPAISESASLTAPDATVVTRAQKTNVTQIFQESVGISYGKMSNMGTLSGINVAGQQANPMNELDFQVAAKMMKVNADIEYTFINGVYNKATDDTKINKTRGLVPAITSNTTAMASKPLGLWDIADMVKKIYGAHAPTDGLCLWCDAVTMFQINADAVQNGLTVVPAARNINGISLSSVVTPIGVVYLYLGEYLPAGTALLLNLSVLAPVYQPVPGKGNFFLEPLAKVGAGEKYQLFGQIGLDHGPEWFHGKFTGISTEFTAPTYSRSVFIANDANNPVNTKAVAGG